MNYSVKKKFEKNYYVNISVRSTYRKNRWEGCGWCTCETMTDADAFIEHTTKRIQSETPFKKRDFYVTIKNLKDNTRVEKSI